MKIESVPIDKIQIGNRARKDIGDLDALAASIREMGLLQPIGVDTFYHLIYGERRLIACGDRLGWKQIPCVVLKMDSLLAGEYAENEFRKQFTPSERTAIGAAIEKELGNRKGANQYTERVAANAAKLTNAELWTADQERKGRTLDIAAKRAGFKSAETFERAKTVVAKGAPALVHAMDAGKVPVATAAVIATQPKEEQARIVEMPKDEQREIVRQIRKTKADKEKDEKRARDLFLFRTLYDAVKYLAGFQISARETWAGLERVSADEFASQLGPAIQCLVRIQKEHPNAERKPEIVTRKVQ